MAKEKDILNACGHRNSERLEALKRLPSAVCPACLIERTKELEAEKELFRCRTEQLEYEEVCKECSAKTEIGCKSKKRIEKLEAALTRIDNWAKAYPLKVFPEPDFKKVAQVLKAARMSLDAISASNMRHVITGIRDIVKQALEGEAIGEHKRLEIIEDNPESSEYISLLKDYAEIDELISKPFLLSVAKRIKALEEAFSLARNMLISGEKPSEKSKAVFEQALKG